MAKNCSCCKTGTLVLIMDEATKENWHACLKCDLMSLWPKMKEKFGF